MSCTGYTPESWRYGSWGWRNCYRYSAIGRHAIELRFTLKLDRVPLPREDGGAGIQLDSLPCIVVMSDALIMIVKPGEWVLFGGLLCCGEMLHSHVRIFGP